MKLLLICLISMPCFAQYHQNYEYSQQYQSMQPPPQQQPVTISQFGNITSINQGTTTTTCMRVGNIVTCN